MTDQEQHNIEVAQRNFDMHQNTKNIAYKALDNVLFVLATGTLVISMGYISNTKTEIIHPFILFGSWLIFICSIISIIFYYGWTIKESNRQQYLLKEQSKLRFPANYQETIENDQELEYISKKRNFCLRSTIFLIIAGMFSLFLFIVVNISNR